MHSTSADLQRAKRLLVAAYNLIQVQTCSSLNVRSVIVVRGLRSKINLSEIPECRRWPLWLDLSEVASDKPIDSAGFLTVDDGVPHLAALLRDLT